jgi:hypothetical protein
LNQLQLFLPCAAGVEDYLAPEILQITGLPPGCITKQRGGVAARTSEELLDASETQSHEIRRASGQVLSMRQVLPWWNFARAKPRRLDKAPTEHPRQRQFKKA